MKVLITGATGLIGKEVGKLLALQGHEIFVISRDFKKAKELLPFPCHIIEGDLVKEPLRDERLQSVEAVINLMGEPIVEGRWTESKKERIYSSRIVATRHLVSSVPANLKVFVSGSAIGIYGDRQSEVISEEGPSGNDFLAKICVEWEAEGRRAPGRKVFLRTGIVLSQQGGALDQMLFPFRAGVGGVLASGEQWMSWIHLEDLVRMIAFALETPKVEGPLNGVAPHPANNREFSESLAEALGKSLGPRVPAFGLKILLGETAQVLLSSLRGSAQKAEALGFEFKYKTLAEALAEICAPFKAGEDIFYAEQFIPRPPEEVFSFFQDANNLEKITPPSLQFKIESISTEEMQQGTLIDYRLKIHGVPAKWKTEIDEWQPPRKFVDNQLSGPYKLWHHTHEFHPFCGGTLMTDRVRYILPLGGLGWLTAAALVRKDISKIFAHRRKFIANQEKF